MKKLLILGIFLVILTGFWGCTTTTPARDAHLVLQRGRIAAVEAWSKDNYPAYFKAVEDMRTGYHGVMGEAPMFDHWMDLFVEWGKSREAGQVAQSRGEAVARPVAGFWRGFVDLDTTVNFPLEYEDGIYCHTTIIL